MITGPCRWWRARRSSARADTVCPEGPEQPEPAPAKPSGTRALGHGRPPSDYLLEYVQASYREVLDATTHQDDKVGRFVAGIAFLTAAALVFLRQAGVLSVHYRLGDDEVALPALTLGGFLILVMFSLLVYVLATSAPLTVPSAKTRQAPVNDPVPPVLSAHRGRDERDLGGAVGG